MPLNTSDISYEDLIDEKARIEGMAQLVRRIVKLLAWLLALAFAFLKLKDFPIPSLESGLASNAIFNISMVLFYLSWCFGAPWDSRYEQRVIVVAPKKGKLTLEAILIMVALAVLFGVLCYINTQKVFLWFLLAFWLVNWGAWRILVNKFLLEPFRTSVSVYKKFEKHYEILRLDLVKDFIDGKWQWIRFFIGIILIEIFLIVNYLGIPGFIAMTTGKVSSEVVRAGFIAVFVFIVEPWIWYMRFRLKVAFGCVEKFEKEYSIRPIVSD